MSTSGGDDQREPASEPGRVLIVDDNPQVRQAMSRLVEHCHYGVVAVETGEEALAAIQAETFAVLILDLRLGLGAMTGVDLIDSIRDLGCESPIIVMSGDLSEVRDSPRADVHRYLDKPVKLAVLRETLRDAIAEG
jgi:DNA-binding NtrC family response regulator